MLGNRKLLTEKLALAVQDMCYKRVTTMAPLLVLLPLHLYPVVIIIYFFFLGGGK